MSDMATIGSVITLTIFVLSHLGLTIWWASRVNTLLDIVQKDLSDIMAEFKEMRGNYVTKEDLAYRVSTSDEQHKALWRRVDELKAERA